MTSPATADEVCLVNIGPRQRAMRMNFGLVSLALAVLLDVLLIHFAAPRLARLSVALPLLFAGYGIFQAREKT